MSVQYSPDGRYWWDGYQWRPVPEMLYPATSAAQSAVSAPYGLHIARAVAIVGGGLVVLVGMLVVVIIAALGNTPGVQTAFQQALDRSHQTTMTAADLTPWVIGFGSGLAVIGLLVIALNFVLYRQMIARQASWAWIAAVVLTGLGCVVDLYQVVSGSPIGVIHLVLFQAPILTLLLIGSSRRWCRIG